MEIFFTKGKKPFRVELLSDQEKLRLISQGNKEVISAIYNQYKDEFILFLRRNNITGIDNSSLQDIYTDSFLILFNKIHSETFTLTSSLKTFLFSIGKNKLHEYFRTRKNSLLEINSEVPEEYAEEPNETLEIKKKVRDSLKQLGEPCYSLLALKYWNNLSGEEIAIELNFKNSNVVKTKRYKCLNLLRNMITG